MSHVRPLEVTDMAEVAALFQRVFRDQSRRAPQALEAYLRGHYLEAPGHDPEIRPLVHLGTGGSISAFIGVNALPTTFGDRRIRAAVCGSLMADPQANDPMAVPRLLRAFLAGPQDFSISETASDVSRQMWTRLRGIALPQYSLDWVRVIRPTAFAIEMARGRIDSARFLAPFATRLDRYLRRRMGMQDLRWSAVSDHVAVKAGLEIVETDREQFATLIGPLTESFSIRPAWSEAQLAHMLDEAGRARAFGDAVFAVVRTVGGDAIGAFLYHVRTGATAHVMQFLARPAQIGIVLDCLIQDATRRGAVGLRGRTQPALLEAMLGRRIAFTHVASTVVHSRDRTILDAFLGGHAFANGLAGETWSALFGGRFD